MLDEFWALTRSRAIHHARMVDDRPVVTRVGSIGFRSRLVGQTLLGGTVVVITKDNGLATYDTKVEGEKEVIYQDHESMKTYSSTGPILVLTTRLNILEVITPNRMPRVWAAEYWEHTREVLDQIGADHPGFMIAPEVLEMLHEPEDLLCVA
jgi:hypothetical protein